MRTEALMACPQCDTPDAVAKVSARFSSDGGRSLVLAERLRPPPEPQPPPEKFNLNQNEIALIVVGGFFTAGIGFAVIPLLLYRAWQNKHTQFAQAHLNWQRAMQRWSELYYCGSCDLVFEPEQGRLIPTATLPATCPQCGGALRSDAVTWIDVRSAQCPTCGSTVKAA